MSDPIWSVREYLMDYSFLEKSIYEIQKIKINIRIWSDKSIVWIKPPRFTQSMDKYLIFSV